MQTMIIATVLLLHSVQSPRINLTLAATAIPNLVPQLAKMTKKKLEYGVELRDEILIVAVNGVTSDELLDRVATAASANWQKLEGGRLLLTRPKAIEDRQRQEWIDQRVARLKPFVADFRATALPNGKALTENEAAILLNRKKEFSKSGPIVDQAQFEMQQALINKLPAGRLIARLLEGLDLRKVAAALPNEKTVFCTQPTKLQLPLSRTTRAILETYNSEQATLVKMASTMSPLPPNKVIDPASLNVLASELPVEARMVVLNRGLDYRLSLFSANGKPISTVSATLHMPQVVVSDIDASLLPFSATQIRLPPESIAFNSALRGQALIPPARWAPASEELRAVLKTPEYVDPLSFSASATFLQIVDATKANYVGSVPDYFLYGSNLIGNFAARAKLKLENGWLVGNPSNFGDRTFRMPRRTLGEFVREFANENVATVKAKMVLSLAGVSEADYRRQIARDYETGLGGPLNSYGVSPIAAVILSGLSADQKDYLNKGGQLTFGDLPTPTRLAVSSILARSASENLQEVTKGGSAATRSSSTWRSEATQSWSSGVPMSAILKLSERRTPAFVNTNVMPRFCYDVNDLALDLALMASSAQPRHEYSHSHLLRVGQNVNVEISLAHEGLLLHASIYGLEIPSGTKAQRYADLPQGIKKEVEEMKARYANQGGG